MGGLVAHLFFSVVATLDVRLWIMKSVLKHVFFYEEHEQNTIGVVLVVMHVLVQTCFHVQNVKFGVCVV